jgi:hypothetical protein
MWLARKRHPKSLRRRALSVERKWLLRASSRCCSAADLKISRSHVRRAASPRTSGSSEVETQSGPRLFPHAAERLLWRAINPAGGRERSLCSSCSVYVGGFALFRRVVMMFWMFHGLIFRRLRIAPRAFLRAIGGRNRRHVTGTHETLQAEVKICGRERAPVAEGCCL